MINSSHLTAGRVTFIWFKIRPGKYKTGITNNIMENKMKKMILALILMSQSFWVFAQQPLNKKKIESFVEVINKLDSLESKYPAVFQRVDSFSFSEDDKAMNYLKSSAAYPDVKKALSASGFNDLTEFSQLSKRIGGGMIAVQMEKMPEGVDMGMMLGSGIDVMVKNGLPPEMIAEMKQKMQQQKSDMQELQVAAKNASNQVRNLFATIWSG